MYDLLIRGGEIVDGTNRARFSGDVAVADGRIAALGRLDGATAHEQLDASDRVVAPGFIDVHTHSDGWLLKQPRFAPKLSQGFTTEFLGLDGIGYAPLTKELWPEWQTYLRALDFLEADDYGGWRSLAEYAEAVAAVSQSRFALHVPYGNVRVLAWGWRSAPPDREARRRIVREIELGLEAGAVGLSTGLDYVGQLAATTDELVEACLPLRSGRGVYVTHVRYRLGTLGGLREAVEIGRRAGVAVHVSHLKGASAVEVDQLLDYIDRVARHEVDFSFDLYPYLAGASMPSMLLPYEIWEDGPLAAIERLRDPTCVERIAAELATGRFDLERLELSWIASDEAGHDEGLTLAEYAARRGQPIAQALAELVVRERLAAACIFHARGDDSLVEPLLSHPNCIVASDGIWHPRRRLHPRVYGTATRLLRLARKRGLMSLEEAVHKLSGKPAARFGLTDRGAIRVGAAADLVVFDPAQVSDRATFADPHQCSDGIDAVIVAGRTLLPDAKWRT